MPAPDPPSLQPPGAGLPWWERLGAKHIVVPLAVRRMKDSAGAAKLFQEEGQRVLAIWDTIPAERLAERVLVKRLPGMEDSSRHWSAAMTVEHLNIVGFGVRRMIDGLRQGVVPSRGPRIEDVKPTGAVPPAEVRAEFVRLLSEAATDPVVVPGEGAKALHPWFGPLEAFRWRCMMVVHQQLHRKQLEAVRAGAERVAGEAGGRV